MTQISHVPGSMMEALRLRTLQQPVHAERLLEAFTMRANVLPKNSYRIRDPEALPPALQQVMYNAAQEGRIWMCWARGRHSWLITCETPVLGSQKRAAVLHVKVYGEDGELTDAGAWELVTNGEWERRIV